MSDESLESTLDELTRKRTSEDRTLEDLARQKIAREDDQLQRNLEELERLAGLGEDD